jgi:hypothetical protein
MKKLHGWLAIGLLAGVAVCSAHAQSYPGVQPNPPCPSFGWAENLANLLPADAQLRFDQTGGTNSIPDCTFHQWSWEAFIWGTALSSNGVPRFMTMPTPAELVDALPGQAGSGPRTLRLGVRPLHGLDPAAGVEGAGAIVEADGNMLVAPNGFPVYASVHMNDSYALTASSNMMFNGDFDRNTNDYFNVGALVFKATWLRLDKDQNPPRGAFVTKAEVPWLTTTNAPDGLIAIPSGTNVVVNVALLGLHVVGFTEKHPEFLWGTFEHHRNAPMLDDNSFNPTGVSTNDYTLYRAGTPFNAVNQPTQPDQVGGPAKLTFNPLTQKFAPTSNGVLLNRTGGETNPGGPGNVDAVNQAARKVLARLPSAPQAAFAHYKLIGTVWMRPNQYVDTNPQAFTNNLSSLAVGSVNLANSTAETFVQFPTTKDPAKVQNCFLCHNATMFPPHRVVRRAAISHVLQEGTTNAVPNLIRVNLPGIAVPAEPAAVPSAPRRPRVAN